MRHFGQCFVWQEFLLLSELFGSGLSFTPEISDYCAQIHHLNWREIFLLSTCERRHMFQTRVSSKRDAAVLV